MRGFFGTLFSGVFGLGFLAVYAGAFIGWCWWMWMAIHLGSFWMFVFGILGITTPVASLLGLWSLIFGAPLWLLHMIG